MHMHMCMYVAKVPIHYVATYVGSLTNMATRASLTTGVSCMAMRSLYTPPPAVAEGGLSVGPICQAISRRWQGISTQAG